MRECEMPIAALVSLETASDCAHTQPKAEARPALRNTRRYRFPCNARVLLSSEAVTPEGENERLKALMEGADLPGLVTSDHSDAKENQQSTRGVEAEFRS